MSGYVPTPYEVAELIGARKVFGKKKTDDPLRFHILRADSPNKDIGLVLEVHKPPKPPAGVVSYQKPSASLMWHGKRIGGIDWTIKHDVTRSGVPTGESIKGWHEHYWTKEDESAAIRRPDYDPKNQDVQAVIDWGCEHWNIEELPASMRLFDGN